MTNFLKLIGFSTIAMISATVVTPAHAAMPSFAQAEIAIAARDQNVAVFLTDFFGKTNLRAKISSSVTGKINGSWRGSPAQIWQQLSQAFNIVAYYDGGVVRVYAAAEMSSRTIPTAQPADLIRCAASQHLIHRGVDQPSEHALTPDTPGQQRDRDGVVFMQIPAKAAYQGQQGNRA